MKVGDKVWVIEKNGDDIWKWEGIITDVKPNYIETKCRRDVYNAKLTALVKGLSPIHRTYLEQHEKHYFSPDGLINIEIYSEIV